MNTLSGVGMIRAKQLVTATVVLTVGIASGLASAATRSADIPADDVAAPLYLLAPATADRPLVTEDALEAVPELEVVETQVGSASFYANSLAGRRTASGVPYNPLEMVAAHRSLPFGSLLRVTNEANGRSVEVRVVDRGPFAKGRILDLSRQAAEKLDFIRHGHTRVTIDVLE